MIHADDAGIVAKSAEGLAKMTTVIATVFAAAGFTVSEIIQRPCCCRHGTFYPGLHRSLSEQRDRCIRTTQSLSPAGAIREEADLMIDTKRRVRFMRAFHKQFGAELYSIPTARLKLGGPPDKDRRD